MPTTQHSEAAAYITTRHHARLCTESMHFAGATLVFGNASHYHNARAASKPNKLAAVIHPSRFPCLLNKLAASQNWTPQSAAMMQVPINLRSHTQEHPMSVSTQPGTQSTRQAPLAEQHDAGACTDDDQCSGYQAAHGMPLGKGQVLLERKCAYAPAEPCRPRQ